MWIEDQTDFYRSTENIRTISANSFISFIFSQYLEQSAFSSNMKVEKLGMKLETVMYQGLRLIMTVDRSVQEIMIQGIIQ